MGFPFDVSLDRVRWVVLLAAFVGMIVCGIAGYHALSNEITGAAVYKVSNKTAEPVIRATSPAKFREATNSLWYTSVFSLIVTLVGVTFSFKLADC